MVADTWQQLQALDRAPYEAVALQEAQFHARNKLVFVDMQTEYQSLYLAATVSGGNSLR